MTLRSFVCFHLSWFLFSAWAILLPEYTTTLWEKFFLLFQFVSFFYFFLPYWPYCGFRAVVNRSGEWFQSFKFGVCYVQVAKSCSIHRSPVNCSIPGSPILHYLKFLSIVSIVVSNHSSSAALFSCCLQSFLSSESFPVSQFFIWGGRSIGASASASVLQWIFRVDFF